MFNSSSERGMGLGLPQPLPPALRQGLLCAAVTHQCRAECECGDTQGHPGMLGDTQGHVGAAATAGPEWSQGTAPAGTARQDLGSLVLLALLWSQGRPGVQGWDPLPALGPSSSPSPMLTLNVEVVSIVSCLTTHFSLKQTISSYKKYNEHLSPPDH